MHATPLWMWITSPVILSCALLGFTQCRMVVCSGQPILPDRLSHKPVKKTIILCSAKSQKNADLKIFKSLAAKILLQCWKQLIITGGRIVLTTTIGAGSSSAKLHALWTSFPTDPHVWRSTVACISGWQCLSFRKCISFSMKHPPHIYAMKFSNIIRKELKRWQKYALHKTVTTTGWRKRV